MKAEWTNSLCKIVTLLFYLTESSPFSRASSSAAFAVTVTVCPVMNRQVIFLYCYPKCFHPLLVSRLLP